MTDISQWAALVAAFTTMLVALAGVFREMRQLRLHVNSRMDQLIDLTATSSHAAGVLQEKENQELSPPAGGEFPH